MPVKKNVFLNVELRHEKGIDNNIVAENLARKLVNEDLVKNVQYRYGVFGRVEKVFPK